MAKTNHASKLRRIVEKKNNIYIQDWLERIIYPLLEREAYKKKSEYEFILSEQTLNTLGKIGCNLEVLKEVLFLEGFQVIKVHGSVISDDWTDTVLKISW